VGGGFRKPPVYKESSIARDFKEVGECKGNRKKPEKRSRRRPARRRLNQRTVVHSREKKKQDNTKKKKEPEDNNSEQREGQDEKLAEAEEVVDWADHGGTKGHNITTLNRRKIGNCEKKGVYFWGPVCNRLGDNYQIV